MKHLLFLLLILSPTTLSAQDLSWAKAFYSSASSSATRMDVDGNGNIYITGQFWDTLDLDPGSGIHNVVSTSNYIEPFIAKLDMDGNFIWGKQLSNIQGGQSYFAQILLDNAGGIFLAGSFEGTVDFDPGQNTVVLVADSTDTFILKLDLDGNFSWVKKIGGIHNDRSGGMEMDHSGNLCLTGQFKGTVDFDPGTSVDDLTASSQGVYLLKLDGQGNYLWAHSIGTNGAYNFSGDITIDMNNNILTTTTVANAQMTYMAKYDSGGTEVWTKEFAVDVSNGKAQWARIETDANGNIFGTGSFSGAVDLDPGVGINNLVGNGNIITDIFIVKLNDNGEFTWAKKIGGSGSDGGVNVLIDNEGEVYVSGRFQHTVDFDPGIGTFDLTGSLTSNFILKLSNDGDFKYVGQIGGGDFNTSIFIQQLGLDILGNLYAVGTFNGTVDLDPSETDVSNFVSTGTGNGSGFVIKLSSSLNIPFVERQAKIIVYPNPANGTINISSETKIEKIRVSDISGKQVYEALPNEKEHTFNCNVAPGIYYINIESGHNSYLKKISILK